MHSLSPVSSQCCTNMTSFLLWTGQVLLTLFSKRRTRRSIAVQCLEQGHTWREGGKKEPGARPLQFRSQGSLHWSRLTCLVSSLTSLVATDLVPVVGGDQSTWSHRHQIPWEEKSSLFTGSAQSRLRLSNRDPPWFVPSFTRLQLSWLLPPLPHQGTKALHPWIHSDQKSFSHRICPSALEEFLLPTRPLGPLWYTLATGLSLGVCFCHPLSSVPGYLFPFLPSTFPIQQASSLNVPKKFSLLWTLPPLFVHSADNYSGSTVWQVPREIMKI